MELADLLETLWKLAHLLHSFFLVPFLPDEILLFETRSQTAENWQALQAFDVGPNGIVEEPFQRFRDRGWIQVSLVDDQMLDLGWVQLP